MVFVTAVPGGELVRWNRKAAELWPDLRQLPGPLWEHLRSASPDDAAVQSDRARIDDALRKGLALQDAEGILRTWRGPLAVSVSIEPIRGPGDTPVAAVTVCQAIARWKEAAAALRRSEERLTLALGAGQLGAWEFNLQTRQLTATAQCKRNHGFAPDADLQLEEHILPAIEPQDRERFRTTIEQAIETAGGFELEVPHRWPDGSRHWILIAGRVIDATSMVGVSHDVTDRREIQRALRVSEQRYREIVETANEGIWILDDEARITFVNQRMADLVGFLASEMIGKRKWEFVFEEDVPAMKALFERRRQGVAEAVMDIRFRHRDGHEIWTLMAARPVHDSSGRFVGALDLFTDITERRRAEEALRESEERFRTLADNIAQLAWMADESGSVFWFNRRWFDYTGGSIEEMRGTGWQRALHPDDVDAVVDRLRRSLETGVSWEDTVQLRRKDGTHRWFLSRALPIRDERGRITRWLATHTDVTEQRRAEDALVAADRSKDEFLAILAHELRNPIAPILMAVKLLQMVGPSEARVQKLQDTILRQTLQLSKLVDDLLDVGRIITGKLRIEKKRAELNATIRQAVETSAPLIERRHHTLQVVLSDVPIYLDVDAARIVQVLSNLLNNAAKYMQEGGRIHIEASERGGMAVIKVRDEGVGLSQEMLERVFHRFVQAETSADRAHGGLGIGLSLVKAVVDLHGGTVEARSEGIGKGSEFTVRLPAVPMTVSPL